MLGLTARIWSRWEHWLAIRSFLRTHLNDCYLSKWPSIRALRRAGPPSFLWPRYWEFAGSFELPNAESPTLQRQSFVKASAMSGLWNRHVCNPRGAVLALGMSELEGGSRILPSCSIPMPWPVSKCCRAAPVSCRHERLPATRSLKRLTERSDKR